MLTAVGRWTHRWIDGAEPWTNVVGLARTILATSTGLTLLFTPSSALFLPGAGQAEFPVCGGPRAAGAFCIAGAHHLELAQWLCIAALALVASGWRPRVTGLLHWWVSASLLTNALIVDGGDSVVAVLTFLLLPVTLTDSRKWHWSAPVAAPPGRSSDNRRIVALGALVLIRIQVCGMYFHASIAKFAVPEWTDGTALYYFLLNKQFGLPSPFRAVAEPLLRNGAAVAALTWGVLVLEWALSAGLFARERWRGRLLVAGLSLHAGIMVCQGLVSFSLAMFAALILYLRDPLRPFDLPQLGLGIRSWTRRVTERAPANVTT